MSVGSAPIFSKTALLLLLAAYPSAAVLMAHGWIKSINRDDRLHDARQRIQALAVEKANVRDKTAIEKSEQDRRDIAEGKSSASRMDAGQLIEFLLGKIREGEPNDLNYFRSIIENVRREVVKEILPSLLDEAARVGDVGLFVALINSSDEIVELSEGAKVFLLQFVSEVSEKCEPREGGDNNYRCAISLLLIEAPVILRIKTPAGEVSNYCEAGSLEGAWAGRGYRYNPLNNTEDGELHCSPENYIAQIEFLNKVKTNPLPIFRQLVGMGEVRLAENFFHNVESLLDFDMPENQGVVEEIRRLFSAAAPAQDSRAVHSPSSTQLLRDAGIRQRK